MRLKRLKILGFKSFADLTKLNFDPGITAIVGPNGCGKSNIADAFRWVIGEQSPKSMRGGKMPDVIFAGTTHRKPLNFAEVSITLSDIGGRLPVDYDEIEITRRLHRSGESEYFINRHLVRLKDVQTLFLDSGMGKGAYSIFEQGEIDKVINLSPLERRYIFEEAAGILRFLQRKREALRKLEQSDLNISRVKDIHQEVEKQIIVLQEQSEKARKHKEDKEKLETLEKTLLLLKWDFSNGRMQEVLRKASDQDGNIDQSQKQINELQQSLVDARASLVVSEKKLAARKEEFFKVNSTKEIKSKEKSSHEDRVKELIAKEKRWQHELDTMGEKKQQRDGERKNILSMQKTNGERIVELEEIVVAQRTKVKDIEEDLVKHRNQQHIKQKEWMKLLQNENQSEREVGQVKVRLEGAVERQGRLQKRKDHITAVVSDLTLKVEEQQRQHIEAARGLDGQKEIFASMEKELHSFAEEVKKTQSMVDGIHHEVGEGKARHKALQRLRDDMEGFSAGCKKLLQEVAKPNSPIYKKLKCLYEYFTPQKGVEIAFSAVMKPYAHSLVAETTEDFNICVEFAGKNGIKDVSFFCLESSVKRSKSEKKGSHPSQLTPLSVDAVDDNLAHHFLSNVFVDKSGRALLEVIQNSQGFEVLSDDGVFIDRRSVVFYSAHGENNVFLREAELKALQKKLISREKEKNELEQILEAILEKRSALQSERIELDKTIRRAEMRLVELNFSVQKALSDLEKMNDEEKQISTDLLGMTKQIADLVTHIDLLQQKHALEKNQSATSKKEYETVNIQTDEMATLVKQQTLLLKENESALQKAQDENRKYAHALNVLDVKDLESIQQAKRMQEEIETGLSLQSRIKCESIEIDEILGKVEKALSGAVEACSGLEKELSDSKAVIARLDTKLSEKSNALKKHEQDRNQLGIQSAQFEAQGQTIEHELQERYNLNIQAAREICETKDRTIDQTDRQIRSLRQQIENAGNINMTSIEECEKHKVRYDFLNQQMDDLNGSKQELVQIITELDGESRKIFKETFEQISANFKKNFQLLFNGGEAELQFTETSDILEAGIEIIAKPPGKQMRSISLLSGGEKCLTAMALLFAVFEVKPSPFCILDEIDAPLDDTNVERFVHIVKQFAQHCQFIIITHNKRTMAVADVLFGVSMEERGVSKLLTMDLSGKVDLSERVESEEIEVEINR